MTPGSGAALAEMTVSFERLCLAAGLEALDAMLEADAAAATSGDGATPPWRCAGRPPPCSRRPRVCEG
jgi:hypothetical protein